MVDADLVGLLRFAFAVAGGVVYIWSVRRITDRNDSRTRWRYRDTSERGG